MSKKLNKVLKILKQRVQGYFAKFVSLTIPFYGFMVPPIILSPLGVPRLLRVLKVPRVIGLA